MDNGDFHGVSAVNGIPIGIPMGIPTGNPIGIPLAILWIMAILMGLQWGFLNVWESPLESPSITHWNPHCIRFVRETGTFVHNGDSIGDSNGVSNGIS